MEQTESGDPSQCPGTGRWLEHCTIVKRCGKQILPRLGFGLGVNPHHPTSPGNYFWERFVLSAQKYSCTTTGLSYEVEDLLARGDCMLG